MLEITETLPQHYPNPTQIGLKYYQPLINACLPVNLSFDFRKLLPFFCLFFTISTEPKLNRRKQNHQKATGNRKQTLDRLLRPSSCILNWVVLSTSEQYSASIFECSHENLKPLFFVFSLNSFFLYLQIEKCLKFIFRLFRTQKTKLNFLDSQEICLN